MNVDYEKNSTFTRFSLPGRKLIITGIGRSKDERIAQVRRIVREERPQRICLGVDEMRAEIISKNTEWSRSGVISLLKERKGLLLIFHLVIASYYRRVDRNLIQGPDQGTREVLRIARTAKVPVTYIDRDLRQTVKRAWKTCSFFCKVKMLVFLIRSSLGKKPLASERTEGFERNMAYEYLLDSLVRFIPTLRQVLIDERIRYMGYQVMNLDKGSRKVVVVVSSSQVQQLTYAVQDMADSRIAPELLQWKDEVPAERSLKWVPWTIPGIIIILIGAGFLRGGVETTVENLIRWTIFNGTFAALGTLMALAHPVTAFVAFAVAPFLSLIPVMGVGVVAALVDGLFYTPRVIDMENLRADVRSMQGFYKNRIIHILLVFLLCNVGSFIGSIAAGASFVSVLFEKGV
jgi:pheromone shutdown-related protein TraB